MASSLADEFGSLFSQNPEYDDNGELLVNNNSIFQKAKISTTLVGSGATGVIPHLYDGVTTTVCYLTHNTDNDGADGGIVKWEFTGKPKFKNVIITFYEDASAATTYIFIDGSNNDTDWTQLATATLSSASAVTKSLIANDVSYKYLRARCTQAATGGIAGVVDVIGTI